MWFGAIRVESGELLDRQPDRVPASTSTQILFAVLTAVFMFILVPRAAVSAGRIREVLDTEPVDPRPAAAPISAAPSAPARAASVEFRDVEFRYPGAEEPVLRDISFRAEPGRDDRDRRQHRQRQVDARQPDPALLRRDRRRRCSSTASTSARCDREDLWRADRGDPPEGVPVRRAPSRRNLRYGDGDATDERALARARDRPGARLRERDGGRPRRTDQPGRHERLRRPAPAARDRPGARRSARRSTSSTTASRRSTSRPTPACGRRSAGSSAARR